MNKQTILITGGAGFIGSALIRLLLGPMGREDISIVNLDKLTYAGNLESLAREAADPNYRFEQVDICDVPGVTRVFRQHQPTAVMHLAAESHVDRSIDGPAQFIETNVSGTCVLLEAARTYWSGLPVLITNCSNNYGPYQFPEKLIPLVIPVSYTHLTLPTINGECRSRWSPYH